jgi:hypothetical protein
MIRMGLIAPFNSLTKLSLALWERAGVRERGNFRYWWQVTADRIALTPAPLPEGEGIWICPLGDMGRHVLTSRQPQKKPISS